MKRKTISVEALKNRINNSLKMSGDDYKEGRRALMSTIEDILHETGNYKGFGFITKDERVLANSNLSYGMYKGEDGQYYFDGCDRTRVFYY